MGAERSGLASVSCDPGSWSVNADLSPSSRIETGAGADELRWRGELEQLHVTIEDLEQQIAVLARENADISRRLAAESRRREQAELQVQRMVAQTRCATTAPPAEDALVSELRAALEELQVMQ